ncbi:hypothetical protein BDW22DRAFT_1350788 [Trametopsis cervina]|nr:hypothetical protein BDW22DRAFT_1350788 [Trametopsis cervina]
MQARQALLSFLALFGAFLQVHAANFTFTFGPTTQCDNFQVSWSGGTPPFQLSLIPEFGTPRISNISSTSFNAGTGSFQTPLPFPAKKRFLAVMSDAGGFASGGVSDILVTGPSVGNNACNVADPGVDFVYTLDDALAQCRSYTFGAYDQAIQPVTIFGIVPGGSSIILNPPVGPPSYQWIADVAGGTTMMFVMTDSRGRRGGSSDFRTVSLSDDSTCLLPNSPQSVSGTPSATSAEPSSTSSAPPSTTSSSSDNSKDGTSKKSSTGVIIGGILAGLFGVGSVGVLVLFFWRRQRRSRSAYNNSGFNGFGSRRKGRLNSMDLDPPVGLHDAPGSFPAIQPFPYDAPDQFSSPSSHNLLNSDGRSHDGQDTHSQYTTMSNPWQNPTAPSEYSTHSRAQSIPGLAPSVSSIAGGAGASMSTSGRSKASLAGATNRPTRFILHQDIEEATPEDEGAEVVELPPQYSERRGPIPIIPAVSEYSSTASSLHPLDHRRGPSDITLQAPIEPGPRSPPLPSTPRSS